MKFWEAMKALSEGKYVRIVWDPDKADRLCYTQQELEKTYIKERDGKLYWHYLGHDVGVVWSGATDWFDYEFELYNRPMPFIEAYKLLLEGKCVRGVAWAPGTYIRMDLASAARAPVVLLHTPNGHHTVWENMVYKLNHTYVEVEPSND